MPTFNRKYHWTIITPPGVPKNFIKVLKASDYVTPAENGTTESIVTVLDWTVFTDLGTTTKIDGWYSCQGTDDEGMTYVEDIYDEPKYNEGYIVYVKEGHKYLVPQSTDISTEEYEFQYLNKKVASRQPDFDEIFQRTQLWKTGTFDQPYQIQKVFLEPNQNVAKGSYAYKVGDKDDGTPIVKGFTFNKPTNGTFLNAETTTTEGKYVYVYYVEKTIDQEVNTTQSYATTTVQASAYYGRQSEDLRIVSSSRYLLPNTETINASISGNRIYSNIKNTLDSNSYNTLNRTKEKRSHLGDEVSVIVGEWIENGTENHPSGINNDTGAIAYSYVFSVDFISSEPIAVKITEVDSGEQSYLVGKYAVWLPEQKFNIVSESKNDWIKVTHSDLSPNFVGTKVKQSQRQAAKVVSTAAMLSGGNPLVPAGSHVIAPDPIVKAGIFGFEVQQTYDPDHSTYIYDWDTFPTPSPATAFATCLGGTGSYTWFNALGSGKLQVTSISYWHTRWNPETEEYEGEYPPDPQIAFVRRDWEKSVGGFDKYTYIKNWAGMSVGFTSPDIGTTQKGVKYYINEYDMSEFGDPEDNYGIGVAVRQARSWPAEWEEDLFWPTNSYVHVKNSVGTLPSNIPIKAFKPVQPVGFVGSISGSEYDLFGYISPKHLLFDQPTPTLIGDIGPLTYSGSISGGTFKFTIKESTATLKIDEDKFGYMLDVAPTSVEQQNRCFNQQLEICTDDGYYYSGYYWANEPLPLMLPTTESVGLRRIVLEGLNGPKASIGTWTINSTPMKTINKEVTLRQHAATQYLRVADNLCYFPCAIDKVVREVKFGLDGKPVGTNNQTVGITTSPSIITTSNGNPGIVVVNTSAFQNNLASPAQISGSAAGSITLLRNGSSIGSTNFTMSSVGSSGNYTFSAPVSGYIPAFFGPPLQANISSTYTANALTLTDTQSVPVSSNYPDYAVAISGGVNLVNSNPVSLTLTFAASGSTVPPAQTRSMTLQRIQVLNGTTSLIDSYPYATMSESGGVYSYSLSDYNIPMIGNSGEVRCTVYSAISNYSWNQTNTFTAPMSSDGSSITYGIYGASIV